MRGRLTFDPISARVEVVGLLNWAVLPSVASAICLFIRFDFPTVLELLFFGFVALKCAIDFSRFAQVARVAVAEWSRSAGG